MDEFEFLKNAFSRLADQERIEREMKKSPPKNNQICNCGAAAISCIIRDYIKLMRPSNGE